MPVTVTKKCRLLLSVAVQAWDPSVGVAEREGLKVEGHIGLQSERGAVYRDQGAKMAQWVRALVAKPDDLRSIPRTHIVGGENRLWNVDRCPLHVWHSMTHQHIHTHSHTQNTYICSYLHKHRHTYTHHSYIHTYTHHTYIHTFIKKRRTEV